MKRAAKGKPAGKAVNPPVVADVPQLLRTAVRMLEEKSTKKDRDNLARFGIAATRPFGVSMSNLQAIAKSVGRNHELAFVKNIEKKGTLDESLLLQESFAPGVKGKLMPRPSALKGLLASIPTALRGVRSGKMRSIPKLIPGVHHKLPGDSQNHVKKIYAHAEEHNIELNLYIKGEGGDDDAPEGAVEPEPDEPKSLA